MAYDSTIRGLWGTGGQWYDVHAISTFQETQTGYFLPQGTSAIHYPTIVSAAGSQKYSLAKVPATWSVARTDVGVFVITFAHSLANLQSVVATLQLASAAGTLVRVGSVNRANQTITLKTVTASTGAAVDVAANAANAIHFRIDLSVDNSQNLVGEAVGGARITVPSGN